MRTILSSCGVRAAGPEVSILGLLNYYGWLQMVLRNDLALAPALEFTLEVIRR